MMIKNAILALLLTGCATTPKVAPNDGVEKLVKDISALRYYVYSSAFVNAVQGCEVGGRICLLSKKDPNCQKKVETCVILNYRQWESVKKQQGWK